MQPAARQRYLEALGLRDFLREAPPVADAAAAPAPQARAEARAAVAPPVQAKPSAPAPAAEAPPRAAPEPVPPLGSLEEARRCVAACQRCALASTRTQTVFGVGAENAPLMIVGEGPGAEEDRRGEPFVGRAGQLLDAMLAAIGHDRAENAYIANVVKCRPPNNRDPQPAEVEACRPFLDTQIRLIRPKLILAVGRVAAQRLLDVTEPLARLRGEIHYYGEERVPVWVSYHPAYLLRSPQEKAKAWQDLKRVHALLAENGDGAGS
jgi:DNA polymerase